MDGGDVVQRADCGMSEEEAAVSVASARGMVHGRVAMQEGVMYDELEPFVGTARKVRITRGLPSEPLINGFVLGLGAELVMLHVFHDFIPDGYAVVRLDDIVGVRSGPYERHTEAILRAEGLLDGLDRPCPWSLGGFAEVLRSHVGEPVIVECEDEDEPVTDFYLGPVLSVDAEICTLANLDALGAWDDAPDRIPLETITRVQLQTPYLETFMRHVKTPCPHAA